MIWLIAVVVLIGLAAAVYWYLPEKEVAPPQTRETPKKEEAGLTNLQQALEKTNEVTAPKIPSANPLQKVAPIKNPIEVTNPFKDGYQNPFQ